MIFRTSMSSLLLLQQKFKPPKPEPRGPLPPFDMFGPYTVHTSLPANISIPNGPDKRFWRANTWAVTIPGLPFVNRGSSEHPERCLTWFLDRWSLDWQKKILDTYARRGYTHFSLSWPDSRDGNGQSPSQFKDTIRRVQSYGFYVNVFLTSKLYDPKDADATTRMTAVQPILGVADILTIGWELNLFNEPHKLQDFIDALSNATGEDKWVHFSSLVTSWQFPGEPRAAFWDRNRGKLIGLLYQADPNVNLGTIQAHLNDAQIPPAGLLNGGFKLVGFEIKAALQFSMDHYDENIGDMYGYGALCTPGQLALSGFGNGGRYPSGEVI